MRQVEGAGLSEGSWVGGDSWFGSVLTAVEVKLQHGVHSTWIIKQNSNLYPKAPLQAILKARFGDRPAGHWVVMRATIGEVPLIALAYAWSKVGVSFFLSTCGSTGPSEHNYEGRDEDEFGHVATTSFERPEVASFLYERLPLIDEHNRQRQSFLALEKCWPTQNCWFRLLTSVVGICDRSVKCDASAEKSDNLDKLGIRKFSDLLCKNLRKRGNRGPRTGDQYKAPPGGIELRRISNLDGEVCRQVTATQATKHGRNVGNSISKNCFICRKYLKADNKFNYRTTTWECTRCGMPLCTTSRAADPERDQSCCDEHWLSQEQHLRCGGRFTDGKKFPPDKQVNLHPRRSTRHT